MFEITYNHEDTLRSYLDCHKAYPGAIYDFTFENRFIIYHANVANAIHYIVLDMTTGYGSELCTRRPGQPISKEAFIDMIPKIFTSIRYTGDRRTYSPLAADPLEVIDSIFRVVLPHFGFTVREEQIRLSKKIYIGLTEKLVTVAEAEVGTGKSLAYLIAAIVAKYNNNLLYDGRMNPVTITTSSIELQKALVDVVIPGLSRMLMEYHIINRPLNVVLRKGKEHYFCRRRFADFVEKLKQHPEKYQHTIDLFERLNLEKNCFDLDRYPLSASAKSKICVKGNCKGCPHANECRYRSYIRYATTSPDIDFQVTNHNLYLASAKKTEEEDGFILRFSDFTIVDEAHKLKECATEAFGVTIKEDDILRYLQFVKTLCKDQDEIRPYKEALRTIYDLNTKLFENLASYLSPDDRDEDNNTQIELSDTDKQYMLDIAESIGYIETHRSKIPSGQPDIGKALKKTLLSFQRDNNKHVWLETNDASKLVLCGTEKNVGELLRKTLWNKYTSHVLTSGTMSDGTNFDFFCHENGIDRIGRHLLQFSRTESPFDYKNHTRLYIPKGMPMPDKDDPNYIEAVADKVVEIVNATNGHTAILFTSYKVLSAVYELTKDKLTKYDVICMTRSNKSAIADFKKSKNGVIFASGSMWEGVDCIGDTLSSVIIVRLPFPRRSAEMEQKKEESESMREFIRKYALPEMLIKLRQGVGRLIRSENDTGVISILDCRADEAYKKDIDQVLGKYPKVSSVAELEAFMKAVKPKEYWR